MGKVFLILGIIGMLLGGGIALISLLLPAMTSNVSPSEAAIGVAGGIVLLALSLLPAIIGVILIVVKRNKSQASAQPFQKR